MTKSSRREELSEQIFRIMNELPKENKCIEPVGLRIADYILASEQRLVERVRKPLEILRHAQGGKLPTCKCHLCQALAVLEEYS